MTNKFYFCFLIFLILAGGELQGLDSHPKVEALT